MRNTDPEAARPERSFLSLVPWRNFRRAAFLILALLGVVALKRSGAGFFRGLLDGVAPPRPAPAVETTVHMRAGPGGR
jgi:hypothetical protein